MVKWIFNFNNGFSGKDSQMESVITDSGIFIFAGAGKKNILTLEKIRKSAAKAKSPEIP